MSGIQAAFAVATSPRCRLQPYHLEVLEATKIGGVCPWLDQMEESGELPAGDFLCSLSSIFPEIYQPYPFLNVPEPIPYDEWQASQMLMIGDVGLMNFFINGYGDLRWIAYSR